MIERFTEEEIKIIEHELMERNQVRKKRCACAYINNKIEDAVIKKYSLERNDAYHEWESQLRTAIATLVDIATGNAEFIKMEYSDGSYYKIRRNRDIDVSLKKYMDLYESIVNCVLEVIKGAENE